MIRLHTQNSHKLLKYSFYFRKAANMNQKSRFAWAVFVGSCLISLVGFGLIVNTVGLFYEPISAAFHASRTEVAFMQTLQNMAAAIVLLFAGKIMAKTSVKWILVLCFALIGGGLTSLAFAHSMTQFYIVWTIIGICQPFAIMLSIPVLLGNWFSKKLGTVMGIALGVSAIGGSLFNPIISQVITTQGWRTGWLTEGLIVLLVMVPASLFLIKDRPTGDQIPYGYDAGTAAEAAKDATIGLSLPEALKTPMFYLIAFAMIALQFVSMFVQHISAHIVNIGMPLTVGATVVSGVMLGAAAGKISIGYMLDRFNNPLVIAIYAIFGVVGWTGLITTHTAPLLIASAFSLGLGQGIVLVALPFFTRRQFGPKAYSNILSIINMFGAFSGAAAFSVAGMFFDKTHSYNASITINVVLYVLSGIAVIASILLARKLTAGMWAKKEEAK